MSRPIFLPSAALGVLLIIAYCIWCWRKNREVNVAVLINMILNGAGVVAGVVIAASTVYEPLRTSVSELDLYILISGLAVVAVSLQSLARDFRLPAPVPSASLAGTNKTEPADAANAAAAALSKTN